MQWGGGGRLRERIQPFPRRWVNDSDVGFCAGKGNGKVVVVDTSADGLASVDMAEGDGDTGVDEVGKQGDAACEPERLEKSYHFCEVPTGGYPENCCVETICGESVVSEDNLLVHEEGSISGRSTRDPQGCLNK